MNIVEFLKHVTDSSGLITFLVSMLPIIELRGAIPVGVELGLSHIQAMIISIIGNMFPVPLIIIFIRRIFAWLRKHIPKLEHFVTRMEQKAESKREYIQKSELLGLMLLVAIPLPGTGAWTGALIAALLDIRLRRAMPAIFAGVVIAGIAITGITFGFTSIFR